MTSQQHVAALLEDIEEEFAAVGFVGLYQFTWALRGLRLDLDEGEFETTARAAYEEFRRRTPTNLVWLSWPSADPREGVPAADDTDVDLDLDQDGPVGPFLALVPQDVIRTEQGDTPSV